MPTLELSRAEESGRRSRTRHCHISGLAQRSFLPGRGVYGLDPLQHPGISGYAEAEVLCLAGGAVAHEQEGPLGQP